MKMYIKDGWAIPINPYTDKDQKKAFAKKYPKYKAFEADGETPFEDIKEIEMASFNKVYKAGAQKSVLVFNRLQSLSAEKKVACLKRFTESVAKLEVGCCPSAGFMQEIIESARKALQTINQ